MASFGKYEPLVLRMSLSLFPLAVRSLIELIGLGSIGFGSRYTCFFYSNDARYFHVHDDFAACLRKKLELWTSPTTCKSRSQ